MGRDKDTETIQILNPIRLSRRGIVKMKKLKSILAVFTQSIFIRDVNDWVELW
jgi:hypothetical protein